MATPMTVIATGGLAHLFQRGSFRDRTCRSRPDHQRPDADPRTQPGSVASIRTKPGVVGRGYAFIETMQRSRNGSDELVFLPLGGAGEIGMNFNCLWLWAARRPRNGSSSIAAFCSGARHPRQAWISSCPTSGFWKNVRAECAWHRRHPCAMRTISARWRISGQYCAARSMRRRSPPN